MRFHLAMAHMKTHQLFLLSLRSLHLNTKKNFIMKRFIVTSITLLAFIGVYAQGLSLATQNKNLTYKIIPSENKTWGYDIYYNGKLFIHQPSIPALPGNTGFTTKEAAEKVAEKVIQKINNGENPPSISIEEMKQLGVIKKTKPTPS